MKKHNSVWQLRLWWGGVLILLTGLLAAVWIYQTADEEVSLSGYEIVGGVPRAITADSSRRYRHELEHNGGKMAILMDDFLRWFYGLWEGKQLAITLAVLSTAISALLFWLSAQLAPRSATTPELK